jgi:hypothetical protein
MHDVKTTDREWTRHAPGVLSKLRKRDGERIYFCQVTWKGRRRTEKAGRTERQATKLLGQRQTEVDNGTYIPPKDRKKAERDATTGRAELLFETATKRFLDDCLADYAQPADVRAMLGRLEVAFKGTPLDQISRADVDLFFRQRLRHEGPFKAWKRRTGLRSPQRELVQFSQVYRYMQDRGFELDNPCLRPTGRGRLAKGKSRTYVPERQAIIPSVEALGAIFAAAPERFTKHDRALIRLAYYTGGRPESDLLRLHHRDVDLPDDDKVVGLDGKPVLGRVHFRDAKTPAGRRTIPLHPEAATVLRAIMDPEPTSEAARATWGDGLIFRTRGKDGKIRAWDQHSYRKTWANVVEAAVATHPGLRGMILRDLRKTFRTFLTNARIPEPTIRRLMGHELNVSQSYHELTEEAAREAIMALAVPPQPSGQVASRVAVSRVNAVNGKRASAARR